MGRDMRKGVGKYGIVVFAMSAASIAQASGSLPAFTTEQPKPSHAACVAVLESQLIRDRICEDRTMRIESRDGYTSSSFEPIPPFAVDEP